MAALQDEDVSGTLRTVFRCTAIPECCMGHRSGRFGENDNGTRLRIATRKRFRDPLFGGHAPYRLHPRNVPSLGHRHFGPEHARTARTDYTASADA